MESPLVLRIVSLAAFCALAANAQLTLTLDLPTTQIAYPGGYVLWSATATNLDASPATLTAFSCGAAFLWLPDDPTGAVLQPSESATFTAFLPIGYDAVPSTYDTAALCATSDLGGSASVNLLVQIESPAPNYVVQQWNGPGSPTEFFCSDYYFGDYYTVFSVEPAAGGVGTGPYFGLYASDPNFLIGQLLLPPDTPPFRFSGIGSASNSSTLAAFALPVGITIEWATIYPSYFGPSGAPPFLWTPAQRYVTN